MQPSRIWLSPSLCGCALEIVVERRVSMAMKVAVLSACGGDPDIAALHMREIEENGGGDQAVRINRVLKQCQGHADFTDADSLAEELNQLCHVVHTTDTCGCSIVYWYDRRKNEHERPHGQPGRPLEHPTKTKRCQIHAHLTDPAEHHAAVIAEYHRKGTAKLEALTHLVGGCPFKEAKTEEEGLQLKAWQEDWALAQSQVGWHFDADRKLHLIVPDESKHADLRKHLDSCVPFCPECRVSGVAILKERPRP